MLKKFEQVAARGVELPLGRTLLVLLLLPALFLFPSDHNEDAYIGLVFGLASALAAWVVFSAAAGWKRRLLIALAISSASGVGYAMENGPAWPVTAAAVGIFVDAALLLSISLFVLIRRLEPQHGPASGGFQFGVVHLLGATLIVAPLALMARIAMPLIGGTNVTAIAMVVADAVLICLAAQWLLGPQNLTLRQLCGRTIAWFVLVVAVGIVLPQLPLPPGPMRWLVLQAALGTTIAVSYLLPRLDQFVVLIRRREDATAEPIDSAEPTQYESERPVAAQYIVKKEPTLSSDL